ncbi:Arylsulfatase [Colletotrichum sp. SAR11_240]|nr:Arylsulfatase [Colletotrichum sp. SAR11_240]
MEIQSFHTTLPQKLDPYTNAHNTVVMSENGARPVWYQGFQQIGVVRIKALDRLDTLLNLNNTQIAEIDHFYQRRLESLKEVDDIIDDVVEMLTVNDAIDNTYIIYTTDQGYHLGTHRTGIGKSLPYLEDTNIPLIVRGPGIPKGAVSSNPSLIVDFAPTFLDIAGLDPNDRPPFWDGSSLLDSWRSPNSPEISKRKEAVNIEYWGSGFVEMHQWSEGDYGISFPGLYSKNDYKTMRVVGDSSSWMYSRWCSNDTELYDTKIQAQ